MDRLTLTFKVKNWTLNSKIDSFFTSPRDNVPPIDADSVTRGQGRAMDRETV